MKTTISTLVATAAFAAIALPAAAGSYSPPAVAQPIVPVSNAHDWSGAYIGLAYTADLNGTLGANLAALRLGYNFENGNMVYGGELDFGKPTTVPPTFADIGLRMGYKASDNLLLIGKVGYGQITTPTNYYLVQLGGEYAVNDHLSVTGAWETWTDPAAIFPPTSQLVLGVNYGF